VRRPRHQRNGLARPHARQPTEGLVERYRAARKSATDPNLRAGRTRDEQKAMTHYVDQLLAELRIRLTASELIDLQRESDHDHKD